MNYSIEYQHALDLDWFGIDQNGYILHVASGGGQLPNSIVQLAESNKKLNIFFKTSTDRDQEIRVQKNLIDNEFIDDFKNMAKRGLYSFDKEVYGDFSEKNYKLVASPTNPLKVQCLPHQIRNLLKQTRINRTIDLTYSFTVDEFNE